MAGYIGNEPLNEATQTRESFTATAGQTSFATSGYTPGYLDVYFNGVHLEATDYTATNGSDIVLDTAAAADDILTVVAWRVFNPTNVSVSDITDLTATAAEINTLDGITATTTELNYTDGVTSNIQTQLDAKQPLDSVLTNTTASYTTAEETKLAGIETGADVTDTANVTAAGALMDSEVTNLAQVKAFSSADYATAAQGALADSAVQPSDNISTLTNDSGYITGVSVSGISDTTITTPADNEVLAYDSTTSKWINQTAAEAGLQPAGSYLTGNQTITLSGDVSGSGTTSISVTVADDSHNHVISNVDGLQTALDGKQATGDYVVATGDTMTGALNFGDSVKAQFGASNDLQIYHNGSHSFITDAGTGNLYVDVADRLEIRNTATEKLGVFNQNGSVDLYYDNALKLSTTSTGVTVTGTVAATAFSGDGSGLTGVEAFPSGTAMLFAQTSAPTGWTKSTTHNDKALRVVSGTASSGGSSAFSTAFGTPSVSGTVSLSGAPAAGNLAVSVSGSISNTTLTTSTMPKHRHGAGAQYVNQAATGDGYNHGWQSSSSTTTGWDGASTANAAIDTTGNSGAHSHGHTLSGTMNGAPSIGNLAASMSSATAAINVQYVDVIIATKN